MSFFVQGASGPWGSGAHFNFFEKKCRKILWNQKNAVPLQSHLEKCLGRSGIFEQAERRKTWFYAEAKLKMPTFRKKAEIAQLVEHNLAKVGVAGPSPVFRSKHSELDVTGNPRDCVLQTVCPGGGIGRRARFRCVCRKACRFDSCSGHS